MKKSKILIITNHSYMFWRFRHELVEELLKEHEVFLSTPFVGHEDDLANLDLQMLETSLERRGTNPFGELKLLMTYYKQMKEVAPDLVITYSIKPNIYAGVICSLLKVPFCANVQGLGTAFQKKKLAKLVTAMYKFAFRKVKTVFFENETNAKEFRDRGILSREKQTILHGAGINLEQYCLTDYPKHEDGKIHFLYLGRIMEEKGINELFSAVEKLYQKRQDFMLDLVGFFEDDFKEKVERLESLGVVKFHGFQTNPIPFYQDADVVILPSYHEGMSNVLLEGAAIGRPLITSDIPGCREAVEDGKTGILVPVKDSKKLYKAMKTMIEMTTEERTLMGIEGHKKMEKEFEKSAVVKETILALGL